MNVVKVSEETAWRGGHSLTLAKTNWKLKMIYDVKGKSVQ